MNGVRLKATDTASDLGYVGVIRTLDSFSMKTYKIPTNMCLSYHVGNVLAPETLMLTYHQFYESYAHSSKPIIL